MALQDLKEILGKLKYTDDAKVVQQVTEQIKAVKRRMASVRRKLVVMSGRETWLLLPTAKNPIRVPASQRLRGGLSAAEVAEAGFSEDYDVFFEREDELAGLKCAVLRLMARKGVSVSYPVVRVWIDEKEGLYRKAVFLLASGRTAKEATFDAYGTERGALVLRRMTIVDTLRPGTTVVEYLDWRKRPVPDRWLDPATAREE
jgi:hypothetical protein